MASQTMSGYVTRPGGTTAQVKYVPIDAASNGANTIVAAVTGRKIRVLSLFYIASGTVVCTFQSGAGGTALTGGMQHTAQTGVVLPFSEDGWFETETSTLLNLNLSSATSVDGALSYIEI